MDQPQLYRENNIHEGCSSGKRKAAGGRAKQMRKRSKGNQSEEMSLEEDPHSCMLTRMVALRLSKRAHMYCRKKAGAKTIGSKAYRLDLLMDQPELYRGRRSNLYATLLHRAGAAAAAAAKSNRPPKRKEVVDAGDNETAASYKKALLQDEGVCYQGRAKERCLRELAATKRSVPPSVPPLPPMLPKYGPRPKHQKLSHDQAAVVSAPNSDTGIRIADLVSGAVIAVRPDEGDQGPQPFWLARIDKAATKRRTMVDVSWLESTDGKTYYVDQRDTIPKASIICIVRHSLGCATKLTLAQKEAATVIAAERED